MTERMTDKRLAEIEARWNEHKSILLEEYQCPEFNDIASSFESQFDELLQALKTERKDRNEFAMAAKAEADEVDARGRRIRELEKASVKMFRAIESLPVDALGIVSETHDCPAYPIRDALLHDVYPTVKESLTTQEALADD